VALRARAPIEPTTLYGRRISEGLRRAPTAASVNDVLAPQHGTRLLPDKSFDVAAELEAHRRQELCGKQVFAA
jgi:hypothetical protein